MNQANTLCLVSILIFMGVLANLFCFGLNPNHIGGWLPAGVMVALPMASYMLGRIWQ